jgi:glycosyltransferase involved in cell wall biosynthesis
MEKKKILLISDSPYATSGLGRMAKYFTEMLPEFHWIHWGVNHPNHNIKGSRVTPVYDESDLNGDFQIVSPLRFPSQDKIYSFDYLAAVIKSEKPTFIISSLDFNRILPHYPEIKNMQMVLGFKWINYFPMDREFYHAGEADMFKYPDINVCITKYGVDKLAELNPKLNIEQIWHPVDAKDFPPVDQAEIDEFKQSFFLGSFQPEDFVVGTVNRSFGRKDPVRTLMAFKELQDAQDNVKMYFHGSAKLYEGGNLARLGQMLGVDVENNLKFPPMQFEELRGLKQERLNKLYRTFDMFVTSSMGEGFGFTTVEALLCELPIAAPNNTSFPELVQDFGYLADMQEFVYYYGLYDVPWRVVNTAMMVHNMRYIYENYDEAKAKAVKGRKWVEKNLNLDVIADQWRAILK